LNFLFNNAILGRILTKNGLKYSDNFLQFRIFVCLLKLHMSQEINPIYSEDNIRTLDWQEHIRLRPGMYIGKLGDGSSADDGIYILLKEILDNSIDEFRMKAGKRIEIKLDDGKVTIRDLDVEFHWESSGCGFQNEYRRKVRQ
jgi:topoisomerase-4 subunit B